MIMSKTCTACKGQGVVIYKNCIDFTDFGETIKDENNNLILHDEYYPCHICNGSGICKKPYYLGGRLFTNRPDIEAQLGTPWSEYNFPNPFVK